MSISWGTQYPKLKTNLRLSINRLQMLGKKKTELAMKARTEIADYISANKPDRARIRVEHIIREDYVVEAFEILEMYCDLLLARFGLIEQMKTLDDGIAEAVISILWSAPRISTDIAEFKTISDQLTVKYGKPFAEAARANQLEYPAKVSPKLVAKLSVAAPPKILVERYLIEIASAAGIPFTPDPDVMREDEVHQAEQILIDFKNAGGNSGNGHPGNGLPPPPPSDFSSFYGGSTGSGGGGNVPAGSQYGWNLDTPIGAGVTPTGQPFPNLPAVPNHVSTNEPIYDSIPLDEGNIYEVPSKRYDVPPVDDFSTTPSVNPGVINLPKIGPNGMPIYPGQNQPPTDNAYPALSQRNSMIQPNNTPSAPPASLKKQDEDFTLPEPPTTFIGGNTKPPGNGGGGSAAPDLDFDELAKRFDQLKKK